MDLQRIAPDTGPWPLHDVAASRAAERAGLAGSAPQALMQRAGASVARLAAAWAPNARRVLVFAGSGNNGGDGLVAATRLHASGRRVQVAFIGDAGRLPADAADAMARAVAAGVPVSNAPPSIGTDDLVVDALLGLGSTRPPEGHMADAVARINDARAPVLAVDLPTGLDADSGRRNGTAVHAHVTLSLLTLKPGLFTGHGRDLAGEVWLDRLGCDGGAPTAWLSAPPATAARLHVQHKGSFGDVAVIGGAPGMLGAVWLAAGAALAAGAGRTFCGPLDPAAPPFDGGRPEWMLRRELWRAPADALARLTVVCGCGGGDAVREVLTPLLAHAGRLVLDADALNALAHDAHLQQQLADRPGPTVLTPHPLEAARLLVTDTATVQADRLGAASALARRFGATVVLKGSGTVIASAGSPPSVNPTGNALLATAGTGDVLAGWLGGEWAATGATAHAAAVAAVWRHGRAADLALAGGRTRPLRAAELIDAMRAV